MTHNDTEYLGDNVYRCKKCSTKVAIIEMPCGVNGPGCKSQEEAYCPKCHTLLLTSIIAGVLRVTEIK